MGLDTVDVIEFLVIRRPAPAQSITVKLLFLSKLQIIKQQY